MISQTEEIQLIKNALKGNQNAFNQLYNHHVDQLFRFLHQFSKNRQEVQDWTQRAFIKAFSKLNSFKLESRFKTWLFTIGLNEMRSDRRSGPEFIEFPETFSESEFTQPDAEEAEFDNWIIAKDAIRTLTPDKRMILLLHVAEGYSHQEIGEILSIQEGTSRIILHRAKKELRQKVNHG